MTEEKLQKEFDSIKKRLDDLERPKGSLNALVLRLQRQLDELGLRVEAQNRVLLKLLPDYKALYEAFYSELKKPSAASCRADYDSW